MIINSIFPIIELVLPTQNCGLSEEWIEAGVQHLQDQEDQHVDLRRHLQRPRVHDPFQVLRYHERHIRYFMYGIGVPILFPIAAFSYFVLYSLEES